MEVHHHAHTADPDSHRGRKKWTHYFWEFFMLFLAVTLGFFVENQREHYIEGQREKKYMQNLVHDLARDTVNYDLSIALRELRPEVFGSTNSVAVEVANARAAE